MQVADAMQSYRVKKDEETVSDTESSVFHYDAVPTSIGSKLFSLNEFLGAELLSCQVCNAIDIFESLLFIIMIHLTLCAAPTPTRHRGG